MQPISDLLQRLRLDFSHFKFEPHDCFKWIPTSGTIGYCLSGHNDQSESFDLLHELGHAQLAHAHYRFDIELIKQEVGAWQLAQHDLAPRYGIDINPTYIEECLDSYRDWLHSRSLCPQCGQTGLQTQADTYACANCNSSWLVNDARQCALRRRLT